MVTEADPGPLSVNGLKRRRSEASEQENKRQCVSPGKNLPEHENEGGAAVQESHVGSTAASKQRQDEPKDARRKSIVTDEKKRSKRLFGALLGNLNQPSDRETKRRREIEERRKAELQRQDNERLENKQRQLDRVAEQRRKTQRTVDEQNMHMRHKQMLDTANFLQTSNEPKLFYRPWDLRTDEEDRIDEQIREAEDQVERELAKFEGRSIRSKGTEELQQHHRQEDATPLEHGFKHTAATSSEDLEQTIVDTEEPPPASWAPAKSDDTDQPTNVHEASEPSGNANVANNDGDEPASEEEQAVGVDKAKGVDQDERKDGAVEDAHSAS